MHQITDVPPTEPSLRERRASIDQVAADRWLTDGGSLPPSRAESEDVRRAPPPATVAAS